VVILVNFVSSIQMLSDIINKIQRLRIADPNFKIFGAFKHQYKCNPVLTLEEVKQFEDKYQINLPEGYRLFLTQIGNGGAGPYYGLESIEGGMLQDLDSRDKNDLVDPSKEFPLSEAWNMDYMNEKEFTEEDEMEYYDKKYSNGLIRVSNFGCGISINLVVNGNQYGNIWTDDRVNGIGIYPENYFGNTEKIDFLTWYELWLDKSLMEVKK
jgi:hypothetical protein